MSENIEKPKISKTSRSDWKQKLRELRDFQNELNDRAREGPDGPKKVNTECSKQWKRRGLFKLRL